MSWRWAAACQGMPVELFFPERGRTDQIRKGKAICRGCPVRIACLNFAMSFPDGELPGVYGGFTEAERRGMR